MLQEKKFLFFYLNTGAGHISTARVMKQCLESVEPNTQVVMYNGLDKKNRIGKYFFEHGYKASTNVFHGLYPLAYDLAQYRFFPYLIDKLLGPRTVKYLKSVIEKEQPTDIVSFHFFLSPLLNRAIKQSKLNINLTVMVTDPFTAPNVWFYDKSLKYLVYSNQAKEIAIKNKVSERNITIVPFALNPKYNTSYSKDDIIKLKQKHGFDINKKVLLMVGGGEGIP